MDIGVNEHGYRWVIEDQSKLGKSYVARLWREGQGTAIAGREGFSTREGAVAWATEYRDGEFSLVPIVFVGLGVVAMLGVFALVLRALFVGSGAIRYTTRFRRSAGVERDVEFGPRGRETARPTTAKLLVPRRNSIVS